MRDTLTYSELAERVDLIINQLKVNILALEKENIVTVERKAGCPSKCTICGDAGELTADIMETVREAK